MWSIHQITVGKGAGTHVYLSAYDMKDSARFAVMHSASMKLRYTVSEFT
jgi:hypothetical protein